MDAGARPVLGGREHDRAFKEDPALSVDITTLGDNDRAFW
jgi:hypothetical protein